MKKLLLLSTFFLIGIDSICQVDENEFVNYTSQIVMDYNQSLVNALGKQSKNDIHTELIKNNDLASFMTKFDLDSRKEAVIFVFRTINSKVKHVKDKDVNQLSVDANSSKTLIYHKGDKWHDSQFSNYLLQTSHLGIIFIDLDDDYYESNSDADKLSNSKIDIEYRTSFFKQSVQDLSKAVAALSLSGDRVIVENEYKMKITVVELDSKRIKFPCTIKISNKSFTKDLSFEIHERNLASAQIGLVNNQFRANNFSISNDSLKVKPDSTQQKSWKSNLYALIELHLPRDIDNFQPLWKDLFSIGKFDKHKVIKGTVDWLFRNTVHRIGIYGGVKIAKDPLSNLYAGFNYAITKELSLNLGWTWENQIVPQVTSIGSITSLQDAKEFAKRRYSSPNFAIGLSFSPSSVTTMLGLKDKSSK